MLGSKFESDPVLRVIHYKHVLAFQFQSCNFEMHDLANLATETMFNHDSNKFFIIISLLNEKKLK